MDGLSFAIGLGVAGLVVGGGVGALAARGRAGRLLDGALEARAVAGQRLRRLRQAERSLRRQLAILTAVRDMAVVANDDTAAERIVEALAAIVAKLLGGAAVEIHLAEPGPAEAGAAAARARAASDASGDGPGHAAGSESARLAARAMAEQAVLRGEAAVGEPLRIAAPLPADRCMVGAVIALLPASFASEAEVREAERTLVAVAKHLALAVSKPTLYDRAVTDALTGLYTKRHLAAELDRLLAQSRRSGEPLGLLVADIDHFKRVNDGHGHLAGDLVLAEVAGVIRGGIRAYDAAFRFGGEEVVVLAPGASMMDAAGLAERLRRGVEGLALRAPDGGPLAVTASFGVTASRPGLDEPAALFAAADAALYRAKAGGRNRVEVAAGAAPADGEGAPLPASALAPPALPPVPPPALVPAPAPAHPVSTLASGQYHARPCAPSPTA